jgi:hypothetical protein
VEANLPAPQIRGEKRLSTAASTLFITHTIAMPPGLLRGRFWGRACRVSQGCRFGWQASFALRPYSHALPCSTWPGLPAEPPPPLRPKGPHRIALLAPSHA